MNFLDYAACPECGVPVPVGDVLSHECNHAHWIAFQIARARREIDGFEAELARYLESPRGRFEAWYAERSRLAA
jgi:hypothetical protein